MCETKGVRNKPLKPGHFNLAGNRTFENGLDRTIVRFCHWIRGVNGFCALHKFVPIVCRTLFVAFNHALRDFEGQASPPNGRSCKLSERFRRNSKTPRAGRFVKATKIASSAVERSKVVTKNEVKSSTPGFANWTRKSFAVAERPHR
jgi:hypothetical protein